MGVKESRIQAVCYGVNVRVCEGKSARNGCEVEQGSVLWCECESE